MSILKTSIPPLSTLKMSTPKSRILKSRILETSILKLCIPKLSMLNFRIPELRMPILSVLILSILDSRMLIAGSSDFEKRVQNLNQRQMALDHILGEYRKSNAVLGFDEKREVPSDVPRFAPVFQVHQNLSVRAATVGEMLSGRLLNRLVVGGEGSPAIIVFDESQGRFGGLQIIGQARPGSTADRLVIEFQKVKLRTGATMPVQAIALDARGSLGLTAQVVSQKALKVAGALTTSFISGIAASQQSVQTNAFGFEQTSRGGRNSILQGVAQSAADQSKRLIDEATEEKPIYILDAGTPVTVLFQEEVRLP